MVAGYTRNSPRQAGNYGEWRYTVSKTKTDHLVPLAHQAVVILRDIHTLTGRGEFVFPGLNSGQAISDATINKVRRIRFIRHPGIPPLPFYQR